jgi:deaminated glutathione amidase
MKIAVLQMTSGIDPQANAAVIVDAIQEASAAKAAMLFTPEMSGLIDRDRARAAVSIRPERDDLVLHAVRSAAKKHAIWVVLGSLAIDPERSDGKRANRSLVIDDRGDVVARYDKVHLGPMRVASRL